MFKNILIGIVILAAGFSIVVSMQPSEFTVSRSKVMDVKPENVFPNVNNLHNWQDWSPWAKLDPDATETFNGPEAGAGAAMSWAGNQKVGEGSMTITDSSENEYVLFRLDFVKPFKATSEAKFTFVPQGEQTMVTWSMSGKNNFIGKAISLFMDCDKMMGAQFEQGLESLNNISAA